MSDEGERHRYREAVARSPQAEHPDPAIPTSLIAHTRSAFYGSVPAWPVAMIEPSESELARWSELWGLPQAALWTRTQQEAVVAAVVRLEQRCSSRRPSAWALADLERLRRQLGLDG